MYKRQLQEIAAATSKVLRDGHQITVKSEELVPGDVIILEAGDAVPADARIIMCASMKIEEAALTGESVPCLLYTSADVSIIAGVTNGGSVLVTRPDLTLEDVSDLDGLVVSVPQYNNTPVSYTHLDVYKRQPEMVLGKSGDFTRLRTTAATAT